MEVAVHFVSSGFNDSKVCSNSRSLIVAVVLEFVASLVVVFNSVVVNASNVPFGIKIRTVRKNKKKDLFMLILVRALIF